MLVPERQTEDGFEVHFGLNYLGHFLLTNLLLDTLKQSGTHSHSARIVTVSSATHYVGKLHLDDLQSRYQSMLGTHWFAGRACRLNCGVFSTDFFGFVMFLISSASQAIAYNLSKACSLLLWTLKPCFLPSARTAAMAVVQSGLLTA